METRGEHGQEEKDQDWAIVTLQHGVDSEVFEKLVGAFLDAR